MVKILSRAGVSLADIYDVKGSIAGIDQLETRELPIVHEMGATIFSERYSTTIRGIETGDIAQNITFEIALTNLPQSPTRLLGLQVLTDVGARILRCALSVTNPIGAIGGGGGAQDMPIWVWDATNALFETATIFNDGASGNLDVLISHPASMLAPIMVGGLGQNRDMVTNLRLQGRTTGFGAGTVAITALLYLGFAFDTTGLSSFGVPFPSW